MNGMVKIPMQFGILLIGALLFALYSYKPAPLYFNDSAYTSYKATNTEEVILLEQQYKVLHNNYEQQARKLAEERMQNLNSTFTLQEFKATQAAIQSIRDTVKSRITRYGHSKDNSDTNYIFLYFVKHNLPKGLVGLLFAVIFLASWGSISAAINSLASSSLMDIQLLTNKEPLSEAKQLSLGRWHTLAWGIFCIAVAMFATKMGSLIEAVNILGSLFYGTILGIFLVAFYVKSVKGNAVFIAALITELIVIGIYVADVISFLWLNVIGALLVVAISLLAPTKSKS